MKPDLTLIADASVMPKIQTCGWGFWVKGDGRKALYHGGPLRGFCGPLLAELKALANGVHVADQRGYIKSSDKILLLQSDCMGALAAIVMARPSILVRPHKDSATFTPRRRGLTNGQKIVISKIFEVSDKHRLDLQVRHVKGHQDNSKAGRSKINCLCDDLAKRGAREATK